MGARRRSSSPPTRRSAARAESLPGRGPPEPEFVDQQDERRRQLPAARVVEVVARERRTPVAKYARETTLIDVGLHHVVQQARQPEARPRRAEDLVHAVEHELAVDPHAQLTASL